MTSLKKNRVFSFAAIAALYLLAAALGIWMWHLLPFDWWLSLLLADVAATAATFLGSLLFQNASVYDPYWSVQPPVILLAFALGKPMGALSAAVLAVVCIWGVRLTLNWGYTFADLTHQDWRYTMLKEKTGRLYPAVNFLGIHLVPTLVVYLCTLPAVWIVRENPTLSLPALLCLCISLFATLLQGTADWQMHQFRREGSGGFIRRGLWRYSRHPNYLGEILMWWGVALCAISVAPSLWYLGAGALANTLLFLFISIPMADGRQSRKAGFDAYRRETRMLLPIKRRRSSQEEVSAK